MSEFKVIEIKNILEDNEHEADMLREELKKNKTFLLNLMSSPGAGKTTTLVQTIKTLKDKMRIGVMEADIGSDVDASTIAQTGAKAVEFDTGAVKNAMILSVPEGDDKPLKYPLMFSVCDVLLINKIEVLPYFDFNMEACIKRVKRLNPNIRIIPISSRTGEGMEKWYDWLRNEVSQWNQGSLI